MSFSDASYCLSSSDIVRRTNKNVITLSRTLDSFASAESALTKELMDLINTACETAHELVPLARSLQVQFPVSSPMCKEVESSGKVVESSVVRLQNSTLVLSSAPPEQVPRGYARIKESAIVLGMTCIRATATIQASFCDSIVVGAAEVNREADDLMNKGGDPVVFDQAIRGFYKVVRGMEKDLETCRAEREAEGKTESAQQATDTIQKLRIFLKDLLKKATIHIENMDNEPAWFDVEEVLLNIKTLVTDTGFYFAREKKKLVSDAQDVSNKISIALMGYVLN